MAVSQERVEGQQFVALEREDAESQRFCLFLQEVKNGLKMISVTNDLLKAAHVINSKLHQSSRNGGPAKNKRDVDGEDINIDDINFEALSQTTRRNSQYKTMSLNLIWYIAYVFTFGQEPELISKNKPRTTQHHQKGTSSQGSRGAIKTFDSTVVKVSEEKIFDNEKKDHFTKFGSSDYSLEMVQNLKKHMRHLCVFAFNEYCLQTKKYIEATLSAKELRRIAKPSSNYCFEDTEEQKRLIKNKSKKPNVLTKLYCAILLELDYEILFTVLLEKLNSTYSRYQMNKFLQSATDFLVNLHFPDNQKKLNAKQLQDLLKEQKLICVTKRLLMYGLNLKYSRFTIVENSQDDDISLLDLKKFNSLKRNTQHMHVLVSKVSLNLKIENCKVSGGSLTLVTFNSSLQGCKTIIFDALAIPNFTRYDLMRMSWSERLDQILLFSGELGIGTIAVQPISMECLQFDLFPTSNADTYYYIRTTGLGYGTLFLNFKPYNTAFYRNVRDDDICNDDHENEENEDYESGIEHNERLQNNDSDDGNEIENCDNSSRTDSDGETGGDSGSEVKIRNGVKIRDDNLSEKMVSATSAKSAKISQTQPLKRQSRQVSILNRRHKKLRLEDLIDQAVDQSTNVMQIRRPMSPSPSPPPLYQHSPSGSNCAISSATLIDSVGISAPHCHQYSTQFSNTRSSGNSSPTLVHYPTKRHHHQYRTSVVDEMIPSDAHPYYQNVAGLPTATLSCPINYNANSFELQNRLLYPRDNRNKLPCQQSAAQSSRIAMSPNPSHFSYFSGQSARDEELSVYSHSFRDHFLDESDKDGDIIKEESIIKEEKTFEDGLQEGEQEDIDQRTSDCEPIFVNTTVYSRQRKSQSSTPSYSERIVDF